MDLALLTLGDHLADPTGGPPITQAERLRLVVEQAVVAEASGFVAVHVGEHHFCDYLVATPPVVLAAIAERTTHLRLSTGVTLMANDDPVRVAEEYATVDCLSGGRVEVVAGRGSYFPHTFAAFGQDPEESRSVFDESVELLLRLWTEERVTWQGRHRPPLDGITVQPRPVQRPRPEVWIGGGSSSASVELAAQLGLPLMLPSVFAPHARFAPVVELYRERWAALGRPGEARVGAIAHVHVARDGGEARRRWEPHLRTYFEWVASLSPAAKGFGGFDYEALTSPTGGALVGSPAELVERVAGLRDRFGLDRLGLMVDMGGQPPGQVLAMVELLGAEVLPQVKR